jgi:transposase InsO family protein
VALTAEIKRLFAKHKARYGSPRITADLREAGWKVSVNTVAAIMREQHLVSRPKRHRSSTTRQDKGRWRAPDLVKRHFEADRINHKWYADGTEVETDEGKLQLDSVLDMGSRRIVGFAIGEHHDADLACGALSMAIAVRGGKEAIAGVIMHTDQGSEFTAHVFRAACQRCGIRQSMGRPGSGLDNAVIESWHSTVEFELRMLEHFDTKAQARKEIVAWIEDYNAERRHSALSMPGAAAARADTAPGQRSGAGSGGMTPPPAALQHGGVLPGVKAKPFGWPTASLDTGCGHHPRAAIRGASRNKITTSQVSTHSGEPQKDRRRRRA